MKCEGSGWTMYLGDCVEVMSSLDPVDHVITDPPYEGEAHTAHRRVLRGARPRGAERWKPGDAVETNPIDFAPIGNAERAEAASHFARLSRRWTLVFCQVEAVSRWKSDLEAGGAAYKRACVWVKPDGQPQMSGDRPGMGYESIVCAHAPGRSRWNGGGKLGVFTHVKNVTGSAVKNDHPTQKPTPLMLELVRLFSDENEIVLDAFAGSATTGVACLRLGRKFIGIEKDPKYFNLACERLRAEENGSTLQASRAGQASLFGVERP